MNEIDFNAVDLNLLKVFESLYEEGGAGRAAIRLGLTQSAVSAALARLRVLYGDHLFERTGRGLRPTPKADELRPVIVEALDKCRQSVAQVLPANASYGNRVLTIGLSDDYEMALGAALVERVQREMPGLRLILRQTHSLIAAEELMARRADLSLTAGGVTSRTLGRQALGTGGYACVMGPQSGANPSLDLEEFVRREHILVSSGGHIGIVDEGLKALGRKRRVRVSTTHFSALPYLLAGNDCIATLPRHAAIALARYTALQWAPCPLPLPAYSVELGWRMDSLRDPAVQHLQRLVTEVAKALLDPAAQVEASP